MSTSISHTRSLLLKAALLAVTALLLVAPPGRVDAQSTMLNREVSAQTFTANDSTFTELTNPLDKANFVQILVSPNSTEQIFTFRHTNGTTIVIPEGGSYEIGPLRAEIPNGQSIGAVQGSSGTFALQVIAQRVQ